LDYRLLTQEGKRMPVTFKAWRRSRLPDRVPAEELEVFHSTAV
jgi:hypothetical protein